MALWDEPGGLSIEAIRRHLWGDTFACHLYLFNEVSSTNTVLARLAREGAREGTVVIAESQTAARARLGKRWFSPWGVNLYISLLLRPAIPLRALPGFSFIASLALCDTIRQSNVMATIKWPNDVVVGRRKIAGVLAQCGTRGDAVDYVVLGMGVNLNVTREMLEHALGDEAPLATSLANETEQEVDRNLFVATLLNMLEKWLNVYRTRGAQAVLYAWHERDALAGRKVSVHGDSLHDTGWVVGLSPDGHLIFEDVKGESHELLTGEIRLLR
ncbi:MAG: biotin--[acetyl-CoA-carboxylase] ligase [Candidatus Rokubacteria bacterium]|nr:biotin--[acetyl-CoA-carboxylase] ligase [Candidatus Rokubacteria bacterium]